MSGRWAVNPPPIRDLVYWIRESRFKRSHSITLQGMLSVPAHRYISKSIQSCIGDNAFNARDSGMAPTRQNPGRPPRQRPRPDASIARRSPVHDPQLDTILKNAHMLKQAGVPARSNASLKWARQNSRMYAHNARRHEPTGPETAPRLAARWRRPACGVLHPRRQ